MITVTDNAVRQLRQLLDEKNVSPDEKGLRLAVERGGCAGMSYTMRITEPAENDTTVESGGVRFFVAADSEDFLRGSEVDYEDSLNDAGFKILNPHAARSCGCGTSFEPASGSTPPTDPANDGESCRD